jgi:DNA-binding transcriptional regulator PaaX
MKREWVLLIYKIPSQPTRLRAQIWRALGRCGALYLQDSVCVVPATTELAENMQWIADEIHELGGTAYLFRATAPAPGQDERIEARFAEASRAEALRLLEGVRTVEAKMAAEMSPEACGAIEDELRRLRQSALKLRARAHFPVKEEETLQRRLRTVRDRVDRLALRATRRRPRP